MSTLKKQVFLGLYVLFTITVLLYVSAKYWIYLGPNDYTVLLIYLFILTIINSYPIKINKTNITFIFALSLPIFLQYGIIVETWLIQLTLLISLLVSDKKRTITRIILTQMMFIWMSLSAGFTFFIVGGKIGFSISDLYSQLLPIFLYTIVYFLVNNIVIYVIQLITFERNVTLFSKDIIWDAISLLFSLPFGILLYLTIYVAKDIYGVFPMFIVLSQFILFVFLFRFYSQLLLSHQQIKTLNQLTTTYTSELNIEKTIAALQQAFREVLSFEFSNIYVMKNNRMVFISSLDSFGNVVFDQTKDTNCIFNKKIVEKVALSKKTLLINSESDLLFIESESHCKKGCKSFISAPMIWHDKVVGVINFASSTENHFSFDDVNIANILASQAGLAIRNATTYQTVEEKSLIDELTGVYNFRAFNNFLNDLIEEAEIKKNNLSLLMIDLDYFKNVNDCYGHQNGNIVLQKIAELLQKLTRKEDIVARYGGEEFTIIIPDTNHIRAREIAERIRLTIQDHGIEVKDSLNDNKQITIHVTASIGVSTYPDMAISANDLIRFSDRALYIGSKKKGRNRVSIYEGETEDVI